MSGPAGRPTHTITVDEPKVVLTTRQMKPAHVPRQMGEMPVGPASPTRSAETSEQRMRRVFSESLTLYMCESYGTQ